MSYDPEVDAGGVGKGRPPVASRFKPGTSGNPKGRPRRKRSDDPYESIMGQMVTLRENGAERRVRADQALLLQITAKGLAGDPAMAKAAHGAINANASAHPPGKKGKLIIFSVQPEEGDLRGAIQKLGMATLLDGYRPSAWLALETWATEEALARLGDRRLSVDEQQKVVAAARTPHKVRWPGWWTRFEGSVGEGG